MGPAGVIGGRAVYRGAPRPVINETPPQYMVDATFLVKGKLQESVDFRIES